MKFATTARRSISIPARRQLLYTSSYSLGPPPAEEDRRHTRAAAPGQVGCVASGLSRGSAITIGSSSIIRRLKALLLSHGRRTKAISSSALAQGGSSDWPYCLPSGAGSPRVVELKRCSSVKICGWKAIRTGNASDRLPFIPRAMPLAFSSAASLMARIWRASS